MRLLKFIISLFIVVSSLPASSQDVADNPICGFDGCEPSVAIDIVSDTAGIHELFVPSQIHRDIFDYPYSRTLSMPQWKRLWVNTSVLVGAGITTMLVLDALPQESTAWNKRSNSKIPLFKRWEQHVKQGPVWDGDNAMFNYVLHPYAGAAYYMGARGLGFNCLGSFLYSFCISTFFWEYGFEAFNEIPSVQDLLITPLVGSIIGEGFYLAKRRIVRNGYRVLGSKVLGYALAFLVDPLNEAIGYFYGDQKRRCRKAEAIQGLEATSWISPSGKGLAGGVTLRYVF